MFNFLTTCRVFLKRILKICFFFMQIPIMENKMKWDRPKKKSKKFPSIEIEMSNYSSYDEKTTAEEESTVPIFPAWSSKHNDNLPLPDRGVKEHGFILHSGDSGIESVQVCVNYARFNNFKVFSGHLVQIWSKNGLV